VREGGSEGVSEGVLLIWSEGSHPPFFNYMTHTPHVSI
jgi:hypothetical protein